MARNASDVRRTNGTEESVSNESTAESDGSEASGLSGEDSGSNDASGRSLVPGFPSSPAGET